jgi:hypothetical protein
MGSRNVRLFGLKMERSGGEEDEDARKRENGKKR